MSYISPDGSANKRKKLKMRDKAGSPSSVVIEGEEPSVTRRFLK